MAISWVTSSGESGIAEDSYEFTMQTSGKQDLPKQLTPQGRINEDFNQFSEGQIRNFETKLTPEEETNFQGWKEKFAPNDSGFDYDLRGAYLRGFTPDPETQHWPDTFKKPNHETFSDESVYSKDRPDLAGSWTGPNRDIYVPPKKKSFDQNNPLNWGLQEIINNSRQDMQDPGPAVRQQNEQGELDSGIARTPLERQAQATPSGEPFNWDVVPGPKLLKEKGIDKILDESGNVLITPHHLNEPGVKEYLVNPPADVEVKKHGDMYYIRRKGSSFEGVSREPTRDEEVDIRQAKLGEMLHDLRVRITGDPEKWATREHIGDFVDKAMSVMGGGIRRPPKGGLGRGLSSSIGEERIMSPAVKVGGKQFEGENHGIAYEKVGEHDPALEVHEGYTTNKIDPITGERRFVSRTEGADIAKKQEQVLLEARQTESLHSGELKYGFERVPQSEQEPPLKKGFTRLYRAETSTLPGEKAAHVSEWVADSPEYQSMLQSTGRWFTNSKEAANYYMTNQGGKQLSHVDVPTKDVEGYRASNNPEAKKYIASGRENEEFFLPSELAITRKPLTTPPKEPSKEQWSKYQELSSQGKTTKQIIKATKMDPEVVRDALGRDNLALAAFNSENALTEAYFNQLKTMPPDLEKALRAKGVSVKDLKTFTRSLPEEDLAHIFQQLPENVKTWWQAGELRRQKIDEGKKASMIPKGSKPLKE